MQPPIGAEMALSRRALFRGTGFSLAGIALAWLNGEAAAAPSASGAAALAPRTPHFPPRARRVIYLHMIGAPSQLDLFAPKPELVQRDGQPCPEELTRGKRFAFIGGPLTLAGSPFQFRQHGQSGHAFSELLPNLAGAADHLTFLHALKTDEINHAPAQLFLHSGFARGGHPTFGSWLAYGLGSDNRDLPAYVVLLSGPPGGAGAGLWSPGFLPGVYQGVQLRSGADPVHFLSNPKGHSPEDRRRVLDAVGELNRAQLADAGDPEIATRIEQYELSFRMQAAVPELMDLSRESPETLALYGAEPGKPSFASNCLLARRLVERGVRMVQLCDSDWDHHADLDRRLPVKCRDVDRPAAALLRDLHQRGLLEDTLVIWGAEFGRTPMRQGITGAGKTTRPGRDHHRDAYTVWVAGGGVKPGLAYGKTDEFGFHGVEDQVHVHDLNATVLHLLGLDHTQLTFRHQGRPFRLTDVHGRVVEEILA